MAKFSAARTQEANLVHLLTGYRKDTRNRLWNYLDESRRTLRLVCRALNHSITRHVGQLFRSLYISAPVPEKDLCVVRVVGPLCHHLTITIRESTAASGRSFDTPQTSPSTLSSQRNRGSNSKRYLWIGLLSSFHQLHTLTLHVYGMDDSLMSRSEVDEALVALRIAIEQNQLRELKTLNLSPIHIRGMLRLCWSGFGAFSQMPKQPSLWKQLETLDLRIQSPSTTNEVDDPATVMSRKALYNYLRSFSKTLRTLHLVWLGCEGPSPLTLHHAAGLERRWPIQWPKLEELGVGNISLPFRTVKLAKNLAPSLITLKMLRSTHRESGLVATSDSPAWIDVELDARDGWRHSQASSVYSQKSDHGVDDIEGVSRSSRSIMVYKDF